jgi:hypothetical protein
MLKWQKLVFCLFILHDKWLTIIPEICYIAPDKFYERKSFETGLFGTAGYFFMGSGNKNIQ